MKNWAIYAVLGLGFVAYQVATEAERDSTGAIVDAGNVDVFHIRPGDCFDDSGSLDEISSLPGIPCSEPHDNEAYAAFDVSVSTYPEGDGMWELANSACLGRFEAFVGRDYESSSLDIFALYPSPEGWQQNDREVVCAVYDVDENKLVGSVKGKAL